MPYDEEADSSDEQPGKIKVVCQGCGARYQVRDSKVRGKRFRAICKRCGGIIVAKGTSAAADRQADARRTQDLQHTDGQRESGAVWYAVISGKPHGPLSPGQVRKFFSSGRITGRTYFWRQGDADWARLADLDDFQDLFAGASSAVYDSPVPQDDDDQFGEEARSPFRDDDETNSGLTIAAGPKGRRRQSQESPRQDITPSQDSDDYDSEDDDSNARTGYHNVERLVDDERAQLARLQVPAAAQPAFPPLPLVPRRRAVLPAPTGVPRRPELVAPTVPGKMEPAMSAASASPAAGLLTVPGSAPALQVPAPLQPPAGMTTLDGNDTVPGPPMVSLVSSPVISPRTPTHATSGPPPGLAPSPVAPAPTPSLDRPRLAPPPAEPFDTVPEVASVLEAGTSSQDRRLTSSIQERSRSTATADSVANNLGFWTTGKIAAAAAIGGGLAVAGTVVLVVALVRPKHRLPADSKRAVIEHKIEIKESVPPPPTVKPKQPAQPTQPASAMQPTQSAEPPSSKSTVASAPENAAEDKTEDKTEANAEPAAEPERVPAAAAEQAPRPAKVSSKAPKPAKKVGRKSSGRASSKTDGLAEADALLAEAAASSDGATKKPRKKERGGAPKVDVDDILSAGAESGQPKKRPKPAGGELDDGAGAALPARPSRAQIEQGMRAVNGRVQVCYEKFQQSGKVDVQVTLRGDGTHDQQVIGTFAGTPTGACVNQAVARARLPRFSGPPTTFTWPYNLR